ncbi:MAG TPA: periplasmic heavy metal sensor [Bacteroidota bacterium]
MDYFSKKRLAFWGVVLLVIMNISALTTVWFQQHRRQEVLRRPELERPGPPQQRVMQFLKEELQLTEGQTTQFAEYQKRHFAHARVIRDAIRDLKHELFQELSTQGPDTVKVQRLAAAIGAEQSELEKITFYHFLDLKRMCTPVQQPKLDALFDELLRMLDPHPKTAPGEEPPPREHERRPPRN